MSKIKSFLKDTSGNYALLTALMMGPLLGAVALSVDISEMSRQRAQVLSTLDATNVATARYLLAGVPVDTRKSAADQEKEREAKIKQYAQTYFNATLPSINPEKVTLETFVPKAGSDDGLKNKAVLSYSPYFQPAALALSGMTSTSQIHLPLEAEVSLEATVELALVLDNSGSMDDPGKGSSQKRIALLKDASKKLVAKLAQRGAMMKQVDKPVQISLVPFAGSVNVGPGNANASWMDTRGVSPIHFENFSFPVAPTNLSAILGKDYMSVAGVPTKVGLGWGTEMLQPVTRFTLFENLKIKTGSFSNKPFATWQGCVESRPHPLNVTDTPATASNPASYFVPMFAPDEPGARRGPNTKRSASGYYNSWLDDNNFTGKAAQTNVSKYLKELPSNTPNLVANLAGAYDYYSGPNDGCTTTAITPLTDVTVPAKLAELNTAIDAMQPLGSTNVPEGLAWGWRTVSSAEPFTGGRPELEEGNMKVVVVLTDGANTYYTANSLGVKDDIGNVSMYSAYGYTGTKYMNGTTRIFRGTNFSNQDNDTYNSAMNSHFATLCNNAKASGVIIMTVALDLGTSSAETSQINALRNCSSGSKVRKDSSGVPVKLFWNSTGGTLTRDFEQIADELSNLRITG